MAFIKTAYIKSDFKMKMTFVPNILHGEDVFVFCWTDMFGELQSMFFIS